MHLEKVGRWCEDLVVDFGVEMQTGLQDDRSRESEIQRALRDFSPLSIIHDSSCKSVLFLS